jgi:hypothetical protein
MKPESTTLYPTAERGARDLLLERLRTRWSPGDRLPPVRQLAEELAIGVGSVNRAVRGLADEGLLISRRKLGTIVTEAALALRARPQNQPLLGRRLAVCSSPPAIDGMIGQWRRMAADTLESLGATVQIVELKPNVPLPGFDVAEVVVVLNADCNANLAVDPRQAVIELNTSSGNLAAWPRYDLIGVDNQRGAMLAGAHLRKCGVQSVLFVGVKDVYNRSIFGRTSRDRLWGFVEGFGKEIPEEHQVKVKSYGESHGARAAAVFAPMRKRPQAVFAASDELAVGFVRGALGAGLEPPKDYLIVGFDGQQRGKDLLEGPLSTVEVPLQEIVRRLPAMLIERLGAMDQPSRRLLLGCEFFAGRTTRKL